MKANENLKLEVLDIKRMFYIYISILYKYRVEKTCGIYTGIP